MTMIDLPNHKCKTKQQIMTTPNINGRGRGQNQFRGKGRGRNDNNQRRGFQNDSIAKKQETKFFPHQTGR